MTTDYEYERLYRVCTEGLTVIRMLEDEASYGPVADHHDYILVEIGGVDMIWPFVTADVPMATHPAGSVREWCRDNGIVHQAIRAKTWLIRPQTSDLALLTKLRWF